MVLGKCMIANAPVAATVSICHFPFHSCHFRLALRRSQWQMANGQWKLENESRCKVGLSGTHGLRDPVPDFVVPSIQLRQFFEAGAYFMGQPPGLKSPHPVA